MGEIERLVAVVPPPPGRRSSIDWTRVSAELSVELPADYVELIEVYGSGQFDEYLYLLEPFCFNPYYDLVASTGIDVTLCECSSTRVSPGRLS
ncbi:hypothetical protein [Saccharothrix sp.]|uniref:hypothetical protein n=1 Tax=Saccharothrix sp. TaxID=1873460 RepID=UPI002811B7F9|nr:hypothetical protein [Saccharothrix sp.]